LRAEKRCHMLVIVGSGEYLPRMEPVDSELIRRLGEPARVVCLPTAAGLEGDERIHYWSQLGIDHFTQLGATAEALPVIDRASAQNVAYAKRIEAANFVYLSGGNPAHLYDSLNNTPVWDAIKGGLQRWGDDYGRKVFWFSWLAHGFQLSSTGDRHTAL